jgi:hypothetical protein
MPLPIILKPFIFIRLDVKVVVEKAITGFRISANQVPVT